MTVAFAVPDVLVARAQAGDEEALEALYRAFETPVYNLVRRMLRRPEDAEDVVQETFLEVVRNIKQYRGEGHLWGWIRKIASTKALMRIRRDQVRETEELDDEPGKPGIHVGANIDLERAFEIDVRADVDPRLPRLVVELLGLADLIAPDPHQRLRGRDLAYPAPEVPLAAILLDVADDFQKRLLHHVFGVLGTPQHPAHEVIDRRLECPVQGF